MIGVYQPKDYIVLRSHGAMYMMSCLLHLMANRRQKDTRCSKRVVLEVIGAT
jgi:hypothetical protein